jgi:hypothetical protein
MTTHAQFYLTRAAVARELADGCKLDNVRESHLRAAEAWDGFAARAMKADLMRAEELQRKSADVSANQSEVSALEPDPENIQESRGLGIF